MRLRRAVKTRRGTAVSNRNRVILTFHKGIWRCIIAVVNAVGSVNFVSAADTFTSAESSTAFSTNSWLYVITATVVAFLVGALLVAFFKRRAQPANTAAERSVQTGMQQEGTGTINHRAMKEELAATAGMLGELLDKYLRSRFYHLLLIYPDAQSLRDRLSQVEGENAAVSFFYFCKLISLFAECERRCGALPLLSSQFAQDTAQRLVNTFLSNIPQEGEDMSIDTFEIERKFTKEFRVRLVGSQPETSTFQVGNFVRKVDPKRYISEGQGAGKVDSLLTKDLAAYEKWLLLAPPGLIIAAEAMKTLYQIMMLDLHDATDLLWWRRSSKQIEADLSALRMLSGQLTPVGLETVLAQSQLPRPIGVYLRKGPPQEIVDLPELSSQATEKLPTKPVDTKTPIQSTGETEPIKIVIDIQDFSRSSKPQAVQQQIGTQINYFPDKEDLV